MLGDFLRVPAIVAASDTPSLSDRRLNVERQPLSQTTSLSSSNATKAGVLLLWTWSVGSTAYPYDDISPAIVSGYGHATRVSAFASALLSLDPTPVIHIVSSAPKHIFSQCLKVGAIYRYAEIDPVIVQPLA